MATTTTSTTQTVASRAGATTNPAVQKAERLFSTIDSAERGYLLQSDFNTLYIQMAIQQESQQSDHSQLPQTTYAGIHPTVFALTQRSCFISDYEGTLAKAQKAFAAMDADKSGRVSHAEFIKALTGIIPESDLTPNNTDALALLKQAQSEADTGLATYDTGGKGYVTAADLSAVWASDPTKADPAGPEATIAALDINQDGKVNRDEWIAGHFALTIAKQMLSLLDPSGQGSISVADLAQDTRTDLPFSMAQIAAWDSDANGTITEQELRNGTLRMAQGLISTYDKSGKNSFDLADIQTALAAHPGTTEKAEDILKQWDVNGDGTVTVHEALAMTVVSVKGLPPSALPVQPDPKPTPDPAPPPPSDQIKAAKTTLDAASATAASMMTTFDPGQKGYIELADIANTFIKKPSLGDVNAAVDTLNAWDVNGDGHVTEDELVVTQSAHEVTRQIMSLLDPDNSGQIALAGLDSRKTAALPYDLPTLKSWDGDANGALNADEITAGIIADAKGIMAQYDQAGKGYFDKADIQTVLDAHPDSNGGLTAQGVVTYWDTNADAKVQLADIVAGMSGYISVNQSTPVSASSVYQEALAKAEATLNIFDTSHKGVITEADVAAAYRANAALGNPDEAAATIAAWDLSGDGVVSLSELTSGIELSGLANQLLSQLDPTHQGAISVASLSGLSITMPSIPDAAHIIAGWDSDQNGTISQDEIVAGLRQQARTYLSHYDTTGQGYFSLSDVQAAFAQTPPVDATLTPEGVMQQWDANKDHKVDLADILAGIAAGVDARAFAASSNTTAA